MKPTKLEKTLEGRANENEARVTTATLALMLQQHLYQMNLLGSMQTPEPLWSPIAQLVWGE